MQSISTHKPYGSSHHWNGTSAARHVNQMAQLIIQGQYVGEASLKILSGLMSPYAFKGQVKAMDEAYYAFFTTYPQLMPNVITYNIRIKGYVRKGDIDMALEIFNDMFRIQIEPDMITYCTLFKGLIKKGRLGEALDLYRGMNIFPELAMYGILITGVRDAGLINDYQTLLNDMAQANIKGLPWMYTGLAQCLIEKDREDEARNVLKKAKKHGLISAAFDEKKLFPKADKSELDNPCIPGDVTTYNIMIEFYCKENRYAEAMRMFDAMGSMGIKPNQETHNIFIEYHCKENRYIEAMRIFDAMGSMGIKPNDETFNILMRFLCSKKQLYLALTLFGKMVKAIKPNPTSYNILLKALFDAGRQEEAFILIKQWQGQIPMSASKSPEKETTQIPISASKPPEKETEHANETEEKSIRYSKLSKQLFFHKRNLEELNALCSRFLRENPGEKLRPGSYYLRINLYLQRGDFGSVDALFDEMYKLGIKPSYSTYQHTIVELCKANRVEDALFVTDEMVGNEMKPDQEIYFTLIEALGLAKRYKDVTGLFFAMKKDGVEPDLKTYNTVRDAFLQQQLTDEAGACLQEVKEQENIRSAEEYTDLIADFCYEKNWIELLRCLTEFEKTDHPKSTRMYNKILDALSKGGQIDSALSVFKKMESPDIVTYNILIVGLCKARMRTEACQLFASMKVAPGELAFKSIILGHCYAGELEEALQLVEKMADYQLVPNDSIHRAIVHCYVLRKQLDAAKTYYCEKFPTDIEIDSRNTVDLRKEECPGASYVKLLLFLERPDRDSIVTVIIGKSSKFYGFLASRLETKYEKIKSQGSEGCIVIDTTSERK